jgi:hypothetical protein
MSDRWLREVLAGVLAVVLVVLAGCGGTGMVVGDGGHRDGEADGEVQLADEDGDLISDLHENRADEVDTDGDGALDYLDEDSDDDGLPDRLEAGDDDLATLPVDGDGDGIPDFRDRDSDNDGLADGDEDLNHDGVLDPGETDPRSADTDGDGVSDLVESVAGTDPRDPADNPQAHGNFVFLEPYQRPPQPPEDTLRFRTNITKVDLYFLEDISVSMEAELQAIHDNVVVMVDELTCDPGETPSGCAADCPATCGDGSCDPAETPASCPADCFGTCGDGVCIGNENHTSCPADCADTCGDRVCDTGETPLTCPSDCTGTCGDAICHAGEQPAVTGCIPSIQTGVGVFGTSSGGTSALCNPTSGGACDQTKTGHLSYKNLQRIQDDPEVTKTALPSQCWGNGCWEPGLAATFHTVTGMGTAAATGAGYTMPALAVDEPAPCPTGFRGYPCFRPDSLPIILLIGDEPFSECYLPDSPTAHNCDSSTKTRMVTPDFPIVAGAVNALGAKIIGVKGSGALATLTADMEALGVQTGSVNAAGVPYVYSGADAQAGTAIAAAVRELTSTLPLDLSLVLEDDPSDAVDAVAAFVDHVETFTPGTLECQSWPDQHDSNLDGHNDEYLGVPPGFPVCWKIVVKQNDTVPATSEVQLFKALVRLRGNISTLLDTRTVYFVVPPDLSIPG